MSANNMNPTQQLVHDRVKLITDEVVGTLQDIDFIEAEDWRKAFDIAERFIRYSILCDVDRGEWSAAGITDVHQLEDLTVKCERTPEGVGIVIHMPTVMQILRGDDLSLN